MKRRTNLLFFLLPLALLMPGCMAHQQGGYEYGGAGGSQASGWDPDLDGPRKPQRTRKARRSGKVAPQRAPQSRGSRYDRYEQRAPRTQPKPRSYTRRGPSRYELQQFQTTIRGYLSRINRFKRHIRVYQRRLRAAQRRYARAYSYQEQYHFGQAIRQIQWRIWRTRRWIYTYRGKIQRYGYYFKYHYGYIPKVRAYAKRTPQRAPRRFAQPPPGHPDTLARRAPRNVQPTRPQDPTVPSVPPPGAPSRVTPTPTPAPAPQQGQISKTSIRAWQAYCRTEKKRFPRSRSPRFHRRRSLKSGKLSWKVLVYKYANGDPVRTLPTSNGRYAVLGHGGRYSRAHCADRPFYLWDNQSKHIVSLRPPITAYLLRHRRLFPWFQGLKSSPGEDNLVHYNPTQGQAGVLRKTPTSGKASQRYRFTYLRWDLKGRRISHAWALGQPSCSGTFVPVGVSPSGQTFYYLQHRRNQSLSCRQLTKSRAVQQGHRKSMSLIALHLQSGSRRVVAHITHRYKIEKVLPSPDYKQIAIVEYTELPREKGRAFVIQTRSGKVRKYPVPHTPYGVAFSPKQDRLLVYGAKDGVLSDITLASDFVSSYKTYRRGHAMGFSKDKRFLYILFHSGIEVRDSYSLQRVSFTSHRKMMGKVKFLHVDGSAISGGSVLIRNESKLYVQALSPKQPSVSTKPKAKPRRPVSAKPNKKHPFHKPINRYVHTL